MDLTKVLEDYTCKTVRRVERALLENKTLKNRYALQSAAILHQKTASQIYDKLIELKILDANGNVNYVASTDLPTYDPTTHKVIPNTFVGVGKAGFKTEVAKSYREEEYQVVYFTQTALSG